MPKVTKRQLSNILLVYIDVVAGDTIKQVLCWILDPNTLTFLPHYFNSNNIIEHNLTAKTTMEKVAHFIKSANDTGRDDTVPDLVIWDEAQLEILRQYIPATQPYKGLIGYTTILKHRCREIFKYDLRLQGFSLVEISDVMGIAPQEIDCKKFAIIALKTERSLRDISKKLKGQPTISRSKP